MKDHFLTLFDTVLICAMFISICGVATFMQMWGNDTTVGVIMFIVLVALVRFYLTGIAHGELHIEE